MDVGQPKTDKRTNKKRGMKRLDLFHSTSQSFNDEDSTAHLLRGPAVYQDHSMFEHSNVSEFDSRLYNDSNLTFLQNNTLFAGPETVALKESGESLAVLHDQFHDALEHYKDKRFSFELVRDFVGVCQHFIQSQDSGSELEKWLFDEKNTWRLLDILMEDRLAGNAMEEDVEEADYPVSEKEVMLEVFKKDAITRQCQLVVDWLEACEADKRSHVQLTKAEHFTDKTICWENTILQIQHRDKIPYASNTNIVTEIDPDAPLRQQRPIHNLDANDENLLLSQILSHIRCGQLEQAQKLCIRCGQPWRAATLEGWRLFHDPNISEPVDGVQLPTEGNLNRDIWKVAAWRLAEDKRMPLNARTIYAILCGNLETVLLNMDTWHDWLWAYLKAMIDVRIEEEIRLKCTKIYTDMPPKYWSNKTNLPQVFSALAASPEQQVRVEHGKELISTQRLLILDDMNTLFASLSQWARQVSDFTNPMSAMLVRFAAHLVLVLRAMGKEETETCTKNGNEVLGVYAKLIVTLGNPALIMSYVSKLPKGEQVTTLAQFLEMVTDPEKKALCLEMAAREGLDAEAAAKSVVESIRARRQQSAGDFLRGEANDEDIAKIEALDWLVVYPSQYLEALWQANALVRQFIASGKLDAARAAFAKLPPDTVSAVLQEQLTDFPDINDLNETMSPRHRSAIREYLSLNLYLDAQHDFGEWFKYFHQQKPAEIPVLPRGASFQQKLVHEEQVKQYNSKLAAWKRALSQRAKDARSRLFNILTFPDSGWLGCKGDLDDDSLEIASRRRELEALCRLCIPEVSLLIHEVSVKSGEPQWSMQLADILAAERYCLSRVFSKEKLRELLSKISEACIDLLQGKKDPWGHPVTS
ncbi:hypothetical protein B566_EDAN001410 [Ephemera danica]|nr:hypothetical protein B566_EDAN001410 [Ephemera danica]